MDWKMPDLGEGVQEGEIIRWLVQEGEEITIDQHLVEIMTDKATMEIPSPVDGVLQKILKRAGSVAKIGETLATIGSEAKAEGKKAGSEAREEKEIEEKAEKKEKPVIKKQAVKQEAAEESPSQAPMAAPAVRQLARDRGVDLYTIHGTGPAGRITKEDVEKSVSGEAHRNIQSVSAPSVPVHPDNEERIPLRGLRRKIAEHMVLSRKTAAHFTHVDEADFTELSMLRDSAKQKGLSSGIKLTYLPYVIKAVVQALKKYPTINASFDEQAQELVVKKYFNIGVAVATEEGLMVPVVKNADSQTLFGLAREISRLSDAARAHKIALEDLKGGTFTLTNIGSIGGILSAPIINYPEVAIMGLHAIKPKPVVKEGQITIRQMMYISVSADHRVVDGAEVAAFLKEVIQYIEHPGELLTHEEI